MDKKHKVTLALGNFDGIHLGHKKIIQKAIDVSYSKDNVYVCSFEPHPLQVLLKTPPKIITPLDEKIRLIEQEIGVHYYGMEFNAELAVLSGEQFVLKLMEKFDIGNVVVGANYFFGEKASYSTRDLKEFGKKYKFKVHVVHEYKIHGETVSSTRIRRCLREGNIKLANELLGRHFCISGICEKGKGLGKTIGFATANLAAVKGNKYPKQGVYATQTIIDGKKHVSMTNVGYNPTVTDEGKRMIETHILDFDEVLYGKKICVEFVKRIRDEVKFSSLDELKVQIERDKHETIRIFHKNSSL